MDEELPFENEPVPAVGMSLSQSATCGHFNKSCLKSSAHGLALSCSAQGSDIFPLSKLRPISPVLWIAGLCDLCYFYWHGYSICLFCSENLLYVNSQSLIKVWYQHEDRKELLMTANSVVNIVTPGIFTSDAQIIFSPIVFFSFFSESMCWYWTMFGFRFILFVLMLFLAIFWSCILPFVHEWYSGLALSGTGEVHVVQTNETIGCSQEMLPTCSKINPMELVLYSSNYPLEKSLLHQEIPVLKCCLSLSCGPACIPSRPSLIPKPNQRAAGMCQHSRECCLSRFNAELESDSPAAPWAAMCSSKSWCPCLFSARI